tara:strand:+ start:2592 stop:2804 length:213 start_codon:yes stop_codon:yes gene_type:complete
MFLSNIPQYLCVYEVDDDIHLVILQARNATQAELFAVLQSMEDSSVDLILGKILDVSELDPSHHISLTIH